MKLFMAVRYGSDLSPDGQDGSDTLFLVRAGDRDAAAEAVDEYLVSCLTHDRVEPLCNCLIELADDSGSLHTPGIVYGPWYGLGCVPPGYQSWIREPQTDHQWVDAGDWFADD